MEFICRPATRSELSSFWVVVDLVVRHPILGSPTGMQMHVDVPRHGYDANCRRTWVSSARSPGLSHGNARFSAAHISSGVTPGCDFAKMTAQVRMRSIGCSAAMTEM